MLADSVRKPNDAGFGWLTCRVVLAVGGWRSGYKVDEKSSAWSGPHFIKFFQDLARSLPKSKKIDFAAHSMGSHILLQFVSEGGRSASDRIGSIVFAAPDVDQQDFTAKEARVVNWFQTLYAFSNDWALYVSKEYNGAPRAGASGEELLVLPQVESIDADSPGHSAIFSDPYVIHDFSRLVQSHQRAGFRGLIQKTRGALNYWKLVH
jgi:esterase/lipase superfamily enzyme